jgi:hypothetical protein
VDVHSESSVYPIFPILVEESKLILHHYNLFKIFLANFLHIISHGALVNWQRFLRIVYIALNQLLINIYSENLSRN